MLRRVVVTGMGIIVPGAGDKEQLWSLLVVGSPAVRKLARFDSSTLPCAIAGEVAGFEPSDYMSPRACRRMDRASQLSVAAARLAVWDARLDPLGTDQSRFGVFEGTSLGPLNCTLHNHRKYISEGCRYASPSMLMSGMMGAGSGFIAMEMGIHGPSLTISDGSASSAYAIGYGYRNIKAGHLDIALAGGGEAPISEEVLATFHCARLLSTNNLHPQEAMRPFDSERDGFVLGEGGAFLVLEELSHAIQRGATLHGEIAGFGETTDAFHPTSPDPAGTWIARAMDSALKESGMIPEDVQYLNAHGTATKLNDVAETQAIKRVFGSRASVLPISSTKPLTGHLLGACGGLEAATTLLAMEHSFIPPTVNLSHPGTGCDLDYVPGIGRHQSIEVAMSNNSSFGGRNASLLFKRIAQSNL